MTMLPESSSPSTRQTRNKPTKKEIQDSPELVGVDQVHDGSRHDDNSEEHNKSDPEHPHSLTFDDGLGEERQADDKEPSGGSWFSCNQGPLPNYVAPTDDPFKPGSR